MATHTLTFLYKLLFGRRRRHRRRERENKKRGPIGESGLKGEMGNKQEEEEDDDDVTRRRGNGGEGTE